MFSQTSDKLIKVFKGRNFSDLEETKLPELPSYLANAFEDKDSISLGESSKRKEKSPSDDLSNAVDKQLKLTKEEDNLNLITLDSVSEDVQHSFKDTTNSEVIKTRSEVR
jgi:hypothetical protein